MTTIAPPPPAHRVRRRRGLFWPVVLIGIGLVALLANYGWITGLSVVAMLALWPVLLILLGIDIAFARRWPVETLVAEVAIIGLALLLAATQPNALSLTAFNFGGSGSCSDPRSSVTMDRGSFQTVAIRIDGGAARYRVTGGATGAVEATATFDELCSSVRSSSGTRGDLRLTQGGARFAGTNQVDVRLANDLPTSLTVNAGAGEFDIDLHDVKVTDVRLAVGASSTTLVLPHPSGETAIRVDGGASSLVVEIPADVEARVTVSGGLVSASSSNPRATKSGNVIETAGYATAHDRVTIAVNGGASSVTVR